jgi:hypothetical protein
MRRISRTDTITKKIKEDLYKKLGDLNMPGNSPPGTEAENQTGKKRASVAGRESEVRVSNGVRRDKSL